MKKSYYVFFVVMLFVTSVFATSANASERYSMSYLDLFSKSTFEQLVEGTNDSIGTVTPNYFTINADGSLKITSDLDVAFINAMHNRGLKVVPFINADWGVGKGLDNREQLSTQLANAIKQYNLDGINIDFEGLNETYKDKYVDFTRLISSKLPKEMEVSVAVAANPKGWKTGWHGSYDYKALVQYADHLMIMAYDESWAGSDPGPVASLGFVKKSIEFATVTNGVSPSKVVLGIPFYGRVWNTSDTSSSINGDALSLSKVPALLDLYDAVVKYSSTEGSYYAKFTIHKGDPEFRLTSWSAPLAAGDYIIWYEDDKSFKEKLRLVQQYNLKGVGSWSLGQENKDVWDFYSLWLDGKYFSDVPVNHWAKDVIIAVEQRGWMGGTSSSTFSPNKKLTRAEGAATLVRALQLKALVQPTQSFTDVPPSHWAFLDVETAKQHKLFAGVSKTSFGASSGFTREQMAVVLHRILGSDGQVASPTSAFSDVKPTDWSYESIMIMQQRGIFGGYEDGTFRPDKELSRAEMAALMDRIAGYIE